MTSAAIMPATTRRVGIDRSARFRVHMALTRGWRPGRSGEPKNERLPEDREAPAVSGAHIMSGGGVVGCSFFSGISVTTASVVRTMAAIDAAFWSAERVTLAGSTMPASNMST